MAEGTATITDIEVEPTKRMNTGLWVVQGLLAVMYGMAGLMKATTPIPELAKSLPFATEFPEALVRFIGISEVLGAVAIILFAAIRIYPQLTVAAAAGFVAIQALAIPFHIVRGEFATLPLNLVLLGLAVFVIWGRTKKATIQPRG